MIGIIIGVLGIISTISLWDSSRTFAIIILIATLYQFSSLNQMNKENRGVQPEDKVQTVINMMASLVIVIGFIYLFI
jgi:arginine exporter protein ArgO